MDIGETKRNKEPLEACTFQIKCTICKASREIWKARGTHSDRGPTVVRDSLYLD